MRRLTDILWTLIEITALVAFSIMLMLVVAQVVFRYFLQISVPWTEEAARWFYAWQVFLGSSIAISERLHLRLKYERLGFSLGLSHNGADFYDLFGPFKASRKGQALNIGLFRFSGSRSTSPGGLGRLGGTRSAFGKTGERGVACSRCGRR